jgi:hypothetical protein
LCTKTLSFDFLSASPTDFPARRTSNYINSKHKSNIALENSGQKAEDVSKYLIRPGVSALDYCDELDFLISGYEDARICNLKYCEYR